MILNREQLEIAYNNFLEFLSLKNKAEETATVKAFEYTYELSWKLMKKMLRDSGIDSSSPKDVFRKAAQAEIITNPELWFKFLEMRNITAHTYMDEAITKIEPILNTFKEEVKKFLNATQALK